MTTPTASATTGTRRGYVHALTAARIARVNVCLARTPPGRRREALYDAAYSLGQLVGAGIIPQRQAMAVLADAARRHVSGLHDAARVIDTGLRHGSAVPRQLPHTNHSSTVRTA